jgi:hypothetical protein
MGPAANLCRPIVAAQHWPSSTIEAARNRPNKPLNGTPNEEPALTTIMRVSKMVRHDHKSMSVDASDRTESATRIDKLRAQLQSSQRLSEYCDQTVAEIRASLDRTQDEGS